MHNYHGFDYLPHCAQQGYQPLGVKRGIDAFVWLLYGHCVGDLEFF